jgi:AAA+ ATPase superfamily predicted ATPase
MLPVGNPAIGEDFIDREKEIAQILEALKKDSVLLIAPRRFGKTSIMRRMEKELSEQDIITVFLEVEDVYSPQRFMSEIVMALVENEKINRKTVFVSTIKKGFQWFKENIEELEIPVFKAKLRSNIEADLREDWLEKSGQIFDIIRGTESNICFIFDEFPIAIKNMEPKDAQKFLHWFRKLRQVTTNLKFVVGGSVSIDRVVRDVGGISTINDFKRIRIGGFQRNVASSVIERVFKEEEWLYKESLGEKILACIGEAYIPYFIVVMLSAIKDEKDLNGGEINEELIEKVYNRRILGSEGKHYFEPYSQRLCVFYKGMGGMEEKAARAILKKVCSVDNYPTSLAFSIFKHETGIDNYDIFIDLIADLSNDFYIEYDHKNGLKFYSTMLRDWWRVYYGDSE